MRPRRPAHYLSTLFTLAVGIAAVPSIAQAAPGEPSGPEPIDAPEPAAPPAQETTVPPPPPETTTPPPPDTTTPPPPETTTPPPPETTRPEPTEPTTPEPTEPTEPPATPVPAPVPPEAPETPEAPEVEPPVPTPVPPPAEDDDIDVDAPGKPLPDGPTRHISFPVLGAVQYANGWGDCRDGCSRHHEGTDMIGVRMQPLLAAVDGTITRIRYENEGTAGTAISVTGADGWYYNYFHVNNDTPGTDDGAAGPEWQVSPKLTVGSKVKAGQLIGYMGDSGNAEGSVPHLHFEIRRPDRTPVNPYHSLVAAQQRQRCVTSPALTLATDPGLLSPDAVAIIPIDGGGRWVIDRDGRLYAEGPAANIAGVSCDAVSFAAQAVVPVAAKPKPAPVTPATTPATTGPAETTQPVEPAVTLVEPAPAPAEPAPAPVQLAPAPAEREWTVEPNQSLWLIAQEAYGASDTAATVSLVGMLFDHNRDQLWNPNELEIGMILELPARAA